jgi:hypothetical protein
MAAKKADVTAISVGMRLRWRLTGGVLRASVAISRETTTDMAYASEHGLQYTASALRLLTSMGRLLLSLLC